MQSLIFRNLRPALLAAGACLSAASLAAQPAQSPDDALSKQRTATAAMQDSLARQRAAALFDVHGVCADGAYETALRAAKAALDDALCADCLAFWASSAYNTGRLHDAEAMASAAV